MIYVAYRILHQRLHSICRFHYFHTKNAESKLVTAFSQSFVFQSTVCQREYIYICVYVNVCLCVYMCVCRRSLIVLSFRHDNAKVGDGVLDAVLVTLRKVEKTFIIVIVIII